MGTREKAGDILPYIVSSGFNAFSWKFSRPAQIYNEIDLGNNCKQMVIEP